MSPDELALMKAIYAAPDDDMPRLVYADWLDEQGNTGQQAHAEFIRLQCERYREQPGSGIGTREQHLLEEWEQVWREQLPEGLREGIGFRRGFIHKVRCTVGDLVHVWSDGVILPPISSLHVIIDNISIAWMNLQKPEMMLPLSRLRLTCAITSVGSEALDVLQILGPHRRLRSLMIEDAQFGLRGTMTLAVTEAFPNLTQLNLSNCGLTDHDAEGLLRSDWLTELEQIHLERNPLSMEMSQRLQNYFGDAVTFSERGEYQ